MNSTNISPVFEATTMDLDLYKFSFKISRELNSEEKLLWFNILKDKQLLGYKFIKQKIFNNYVVDFYCPELLLIIELDDGNDSYAVDSTRNSYFERMGVKILRVMNNDIQNNIDRVRVYLEDYIKSTKITRITSPITSPM